MSGNFTIGSAPVGTDNPSQLYFHEFVIYDSINWTQSGNLCWDATNQVFYVVPFTDKGVKSEPKKTKLSNIK